MGATQQQWLVFSADNHAFATNTADIIEIVRITDLLPSSEPMPGVLGWINVRGDMVPVIDIAEHIFHKSSDYEHQEIIVIQGKEQLIGLMAQRVLAVTEKGHEKKLDHCLVDNALLNDVHYVKPETIAIMRHS